MTILAPAKGGCVMDPRPAMVAEEASCLLLQIISPVVIKTARSYKAQWTELYSTHAKSQWVERFIHRLKTSFWLISSNLGETQRFV